MSNTTAVACNIVSAATASAVARSMDTWVDVDRDGDPQQGSKRDGGVRLRSRVAGNISFGLMASSRSEATSCCDISKCRGK